MDKKSLIFRLVSVVAILIPITLSIFFFIDILRVNADGSLTFNLICIGVILAFCLFEVIVLLVNIKKSLALEAIAFNKTKDVNRMGLVIAEIMTGVGAALLTLSVVLYLVKNADINVKYSSEVIMIVSVLLFVNCLLYNLFLIMFKNRPFKITDLE